VPNEAAFLTGRCAHVPFGGNPCVAWSARTGPRFGGLQAAGQSSSWPSTGPAHPRRGSLLARCERRPSLYVVLQGVPRNPVLRRPRRLPPPRPRGARPAHVAPNPSAWPAAIRGQSYVAVPRLGYLCRRPARPWWDANVLAGAGAWRRERVGAPRTSATPGAPRVGGLRDSNFFEEAQRRPRRSITACGCAVWATRVVSRAG